MVDLDLSAVLMLTALMVLRMGVPILGLFLLNRILKRVLSSSS
jgi:hypothetical protein